MRLAKLRLAKARTLGTGGKFSAGPGAIPVQPGDVVLVTADLPDWLYAEKRVVEKRLFGLGSEDQFLSELVVEDYQEAIYSDTGAAPRGLPTRATPTLTASVLSATVGSVWLSWTWNDSAYAVQENEVYRGSSAGVSIDPSKLVGRTHGRSFVYSALPAERDTTLYFVVRAITDRSDHPA